MPDSPRNTEAGPLPESEVERARKPESLPRSKEQIIEDAGAEERSRGRPPSRSGLPQKLSRATLQRHPANRVMAARVGILVILVAVLLAYAIAAVLWPRPTEVADEPEEPRNSLAEANYLREISWVILQGKNSTLRYEQITEAFFSGEIRRTDALLLLNSARSSMRDLLSALGFAVVPCSTYESLHADVIRALDNLVGAFNFTIRGVSGASLDGLRLGIDHFLAADEYLTSATDKVDTLAESAPNCVRFE